jgi:hypothetical protein
MVTLKFKAALLCKLNITVMTIPGVNPELRYLQY